MPVGVKMRKGMKAHAEQAGRLQGMKRIKHKDISMKLVYSRATVPGSSSNTSAGIIAVPLQ